MEQNLEDQVKSVISNGQTMNLQEKNFKIGMENNIASKYLKSINSIIRAEYNNSKSDQRNAVMTGNNFINHKTCKILFKLLFSMFTHIFHY